MVKDLQQLKKQYEVDADMMGSKSRFGFFSIPPSHTAAKTDYAKGSECRKNQDGRVTTQLRNIFSGGTSSGIMKKAYFSVPKSIYQGDPYDKRHSQNVSKEQKGDANTDNTKDKVKETKVVADREIFKPVKIQKTLASSSYNYICENPQKKNAKRYRNPDGSVKTKPRNICSNSEFKLDHERSKTFKYSFSDFDTQKKIRNRQIMTSISMRRGEGPFRAGNTGKHFFSSNIQAFNDHEIKNKMKKVSSNRKVAAHEGAFVPSCRAHDKLFSYPKYDDPKIVKPANSDQHKQSTQAATGAGEHQQKQKFDESKMPQQLFRLPNKVFSSKPCPSVSCSRMNLLRKLR